MSDPISKSELTNLINKGIVFDIFYAEKYSTLFRSISEQESKLKSRGESYSSFFGTIEKALSDECVLALTRIYDSIPNNPKYITCCVEGVLKFIDVNSARLPRIGERHILFEQMLLAGFEEKVIKQGHQYTDEQITRFIITHFRNLISEPGHKSVINSLRLIRDKRIAHNESFEGEIKEVTFSQMDELIDRAKKLVGILGWAYLNTAFVIDDEYVLSEGAQRIKKSAEIVLNDLLNVHRTR
jgi:hypothetical protein